MSKLGEYFHKKFYPDLDINLIEQQLNKPKIFNDAINFVHKNHYSDLPIEIVSNNFKGEHPPISMQQQSDDLMSKYSNLNFVQRANSNSKLKIPQGGNNFATHKMAYSTDEYGNNIVFPLVVQQGDKLIDFSEGVDMNNKDQRRMAFNKAQEYAIEKGEFIPVGNDNQFAEYFSSVGYKKNMGEDVYNDAFNEYLNRTGKNLPETVIRP